MRVLTKEWIDKAEGDFHTASREARVSKMPNYDAVCFHCQQCAEKYLKAFLQEKDQPFGRTHDLIELLELCLPLDPTFETQRDALKDLTKYAVEFRYPGEMAVREEARAALRAIRSFRDFIRQKLGL
jgi:HEPN domain-containing protein